MTFDDQKLFCLTPSSFVVEDTIAVPRNSVRCPYSEADEVGVLRLLSNNHDPRHGYEHSVMRQVHKQGNEKHVRKTHTSGTEGCANSNQNFVRCCKYKRDIRSFKTQETPHLRACIQTQGRFDTLPEARHLLPNITPCGSKEKMRSPTSHRAAPSPDLGHVTAGRRDSGTCYPAPDDGEIDASLHYPIASRPVWPGSAPAASERGRSCRQGEGCRLCRSDNALAFVVRRPQPPRQDSPGAFPSATRGDPLGDMLHPLPFN